MFDLLFAVSIVGTAVQAIQEACTPTIPAENWANKELYHKDIMDGVSVEQRMKNLKNGRYKLSQQELNTKKKNVVNDNRKHIYTL